MIDILNSAQADAALALYPLFIPGWKEGLLPANTYHGGAPLTIYSPSTSLFIVIDPLLTLSITLGIGDSVRLWVNNVATSLVKPIKEGMENERITMELPWGELNNGENTLHYRVTRLSGNFNSSPTVKLLYHYPACEITVSHPPSVGPTQSATFTLTRNYPREYDVLTLTVGTWSKKIPYAHPTNPVGYTLSAAELQQIGPGTHPVSAKVADQLGNFKVSPTSSIVISTTPPEWVDHYTSLADYNYNGWIPHAAARSGSIRQFRMNNQLITAFFNFTDQGAPTGFAGTILYRDFLFVPGNYRFTFEATHVADSPNPSLVNPILGADTSLGRGDCYVVPKNGIWHHLQEDFIIPERRIARLYITNFQDSSHGNDFGIRNIRVVKLEVGGIMSAPQTLPQAPLYEGPSLPDIEYPE